MVVCSWWRGVCVCWRASVRGAVTVVYTGVPRKKRRFRKEAETPSGAFRGATPPEEIDDDDCARRPPETRAWGRKC